ncbi:NADH-quinone oxidoreductase subunit L, partial [Mycolicibacterium komossense]|nr:NADH-quinone oxidoreductase subunit L [Mycolicibacterium komossense]
AIGGTLEHWLAPVVGAVPDTQHPTPIWTLTTLTLTAVATGIATAYRMYATRTVKAVPSEWVSLPVFAARNDLYGDVLNERLLMVPGRRLSHVLHIVDVQGVDGFVEAVPRVIGALSMRIRLLQNGFARSYAVAIFVGATAVLGGLAAVRLS